MNAIELFVKLYNDEVGKAQCIEVIHPNEEDHYIFRNLRDNFDLQELMSSLLFKEYKFELRNQQEIKAMLNEKERLRRIEDLEREIEKLKKEDEK